MAQRRARFLDYVKAAFLWHWNLLAMGAGVALAIFSRQPGVVLPLVAAGELTYLGLAVGNRRLRNVVDARLAAPAASPPQTEQLQRILSALGREDAERFQSLRRHCMELHRLGEQFRGGPAPGEAAFTRMRSDSLDRLLWVFLKLLYSKDALDRFLDATDRAGLLRSKADAEKRLAQAQKAGRSEELLRSLQDNLETVGQRLANFERACENRELIAAELDRIEQKISAISEMSLSARDPSDISSQVDGIAAGVSATEEALRGIDVLPTLQDDSPPPLMQEEA